MKVVNSQQLQSTVEYDLFIHIDSLRQDGKSWRQIEKIIGKDKSYLHKYHKKQKTKRYNTTINKTKSERLLDTSQSMELDSSVITSLSPLNSFLPNKSPILNTKSNSPEILSLYNIPEIDTRKWSWKKFAKKFLSISLLEHQIKDLIAIEKYSRLILNDPRRYGKTFIVEFTFVIRKMVESVYKKKDEPIIFISAVSSVVEIFALDIRHELESNEELLEFYGPLIDDTAKNTSLIINIVTRKNRSKHSFIALMSGSKSRGLGARWCLIDDPVDVFHPSEIHGLTKKIMRWIKQKILPIMKGGSIALVGTRYDIKDVYILLDHLIWKTIKRCAIIKWGEYTIPGNLANYKASDIKYSGDWEILAPELFKNLPSDPKADPIQNMLYILEDMGNKEFNQEMQNNPIPLNPNIDYKWFKHIDQLPTRAEAMKWVAFVDPAVSEKDGDFTSMSLIGYWIKEYYLYDILHGRYSMLKKIEMIESDILRWEQVLNVNIRLYIETLMNQQETYQTIRDRPNNISPIKINPKDRGSKEFRITANLSLSAEKGEIYIVKGCRNLHVLEQEVNGFPYAEHDDIIDSLDQGHYQLKKQAKSFQYSM